MSTFLKDLETLINSHSKENGSDTPDWILAEYLDNCLKSFDTAMFHRKAWYSEEDTNNPVDTNNRQEIDAEYWHDWVSDNKPPNTNKEG